MSIEIPSDYSPFVQRLISEGKFQSVGDVVAEGLRLIVMREKLHEDIQVGLISRQAIVSKQAQSTQKQDAGLK